MEIQGNVVYSRLQTFLDTSFLYKRDFNVFLYTNPNTYYIYG